VEHYIVPMGAAIWSAPVNAVLGMPACFFLRFFRNHGMLSVDQRPVWRVVQGGSQAYVQALLAQLRQSVRLSAPIAQLRRTPEAVELTPRGGPPERYDAVVLACHSDEALTLLADPSPAELEVLSALRYQPNDVVLHTDTSVMPRCRRAWAAWNYHLPAELRSTVAVTYWMNCLQGLDAQTQFLVTLNDTSRIAPEKVLRRFRYSHPQFGIESLAAQARHGEISGVRRTHYCGAYWRYGFHEDGVMSALRVCQQLGLELDPAHAFAWK
jgi:predicted NAD/FAD-binding protein